MAEGHVQEYRGSDSGVSGGDSTPAALDEDIQNDMLNAMFHRIRILKMIIKGVIDVPQNRLSSLLTGLIFWLLNALSSQRLMSSMCGSW